MRDYWWVKNILKAQDLGALKEKNMIDYSYLHKTSWCSMPWIHQFINPQGEVKPCCRFLLSEKQRTENNLNKKTLDDIFSGSFMNEIRLKMLRNKKVEGCLRCYEEEASHKSSLRERYNRREYRKNKRGFLLNE